MPYFPLYLYHFYLLCLCGNASRFDDESLSEWYFSLTPPLSDVLCVFLCVPVNVLYASGELRIVYVGAFRCVYFGVIRLY